jgi:hypothetical protein
MCNLHIKDMHPCTRQYKCAIYPLCYKRLIISSPHSPASLSRAGYPFGDLTERLKGHYVQAASEQSDGKITDSRLSVMTGLQRRDIARLRAFEHKAPKPNPLTRLVALWQAHPDYSHKGKAKPLPRTGDAPSFESLAREVRQDVHPRAMLDTLFAAGTVKLDQDTVALAQTAYVPLAGSEEQLDYLAENVGDHLAAAAENVLGPHPRHFERAAHYTGPHRRTDQISR